MKSILSFVFLLTLSSTGAAQERNWSWSSSFGVSRTYFYSLTDFLSGFGDNIDRSQNAVMIEGRLNRDLLPWLGTSVAYQFDYASFNQVLSGQDQSYGLSQNSLTFFPYVIIFSDKNSEWIAGIQAGKTWYSLSTTGLGAVLPETKTANGWLTGVRTDFDFLSGESVHILFSGGFNLKTSETVSHGRYDFTFKSLDAYVKLGILNEF